MSKKTPKPVVSKKPVLLQKPHESGEVDKTFQSLTQTDEIVRWGLPYDPAPARWSDAHSGHVFKDSAGDKFVIDASGKNEWQAYRLADVVLLKDDNTPGTEE